jgi:hypothetical protein
MLGFNIGTTRQRAARDRHGVDDVARHRRMRVGRLARDRTGNGTDMGRRTFMARARRAVSSDARRLRARAGESSLFIYQVGRRLETAARDNRQQCSFLGSPLRCFHLSRNRISPQALRQWANGVVAGDIAGNSPGPITVAHGDYLAPTARRITRSRVGRDSSIVSRRHRGALPPWLVRPS